MKTILRIDWVDYVVDMTPAEMTAVNKVLGALAHMQDYADDERRVTLGKRKLDYAIRVLPDDTTITTPSEE